MSNDIKVLGGRYEIIRAIGYGGMAEVYLAHDTVLDRDVAIKVLRDQFTCDKNFVKQFEREAKSAARLTDPNIINVYDVVCDEEQQFIVMEYVDGVTLKEFLTENKPSLEETLEIISRAASGLGHAHRQNIIHCDVKPHNILIDKNLNPKIADFGIAKTISNQTQVYSSEVMGSVHYLSPEQADGGRITAATDVYSLGVVLFEMLTGNVPFSGPNIACVTTMHLNKPVPKLVDYLETVPEGLQEIVDKALAKNSTDRYANGDEFAEALNNIIMKLFPDSEHHIELARREDLVTNKPTDDGDDDEKTVVVNHGHVGEKRRPNVEDLNIMAPKRDNIVKDSKKDEKEEDSVNRKINYSRLMLLVTGIVVAISMIANLYFNRERKVVEIPQVVNMSITEAKTILDKNDFKIKIIEKHDANSKAGQVLDQNPKPGEKRKEGTMISLTVSKGGELKTMPNIVGMGIVKAENILSEAGFKIGKTTSRYEKDKSIGTVLEQSLKADEKLAAGTAVDIVVCEGTNEVPKLQGKNLKEAKGILEAAGLTLGEIKYVSDQSVGPNIIMASNPLAGMKIAKGDPVMITVSDGGKTNDTIVEFIVPGKDATSVSVVLLDSGNRKTLYSGTQKGGVRLRYKVSAHAEAKVQFFAGGKMVEERSL